MPRLEDRYFASRPTSDMAERSHIVHALRRLLVRAKEPTARTLAKKDESSPRMLLALNAKGILEPDTADASSNASPR